ncbi:hypothetical protein [Deinococcus pimensis]|uniref:hypothetical protein n=1 Tax=Deinococcus pimensis TaxID=309888 RepID=UPI0004838954|nr:hypothetical protein [Deinococcus pimensis]
MIRAAQLLTAALTSFALMGCTTTPTPPDTRAFVARVELTSTAALLTASGDTATLRAAAYDVQGRPVQIEGPVLWSSSNENVLHVDGAGHATAKAEIGTARVTATVNGVPSRPMLLTVARTARDTLLVTDEQLTSAPARVDGGSTDTSVGARFTVSVRDDVTPNVGQVLLSTGVSPVVGRVLAVQPRASGRLVTLETVALTDAYRELRVQDHVQLDLATLVAQNGPFAPERIERHHDGTVTLTYRLPETTMSRQSTTLPDDDILPGPFAKKDFTVGPFECGSTLDTLLSGDLISVKLESKMDVDYDAVVSNGELTALGAELNGELTGTVTGGLDLDLGVQGELKCRAVLGRLPIPVSGPLASFFAPTVPLGLGFLLDGKLKLGKVQFALEGKLGGKLQAGVTYDRVSGSMTERHKLEPVNTLTPQLKLLLPDEALRLEGGVGVHATAGLDFTPFPWLVDATPSFKALDVTFGPRFEGSVAPTGTQALVNDYASSYALKLVGTMGPGDDLQELLAVMGTRNQVKVFGAAPLVEGTMARSPNGTLSGPTTVTVATPAKLSVDLKAANVSFIPGSYNVREVLLFRDRDGTLEPFARQVADEGATHFEFPWTPLAEDAGRAVTFRAFVVSNALRGVPLEIDDDAKFSVTVERGSPSPPQRTGWKGTIKYSWSGVLDSTQMDPYYGELKHHHDAKGSLTCDLQGVDADGNERTDWTYDNVTFTWDEDRIGRIEERHVAYASKSFVSPYAGGISNVYFAPTEDAVTRTYNRYEYGQLVQTWNGKVKLELSGSCLVDGLTQHLTEVDGRIVYTADILPVHVGGYGMNDGFKETVEINLVRQ